MKNTGKISLDTSAPGKAGSQESETQKVKSSWNAKRVIAVVAIILLAGIYVAAFIAAFFADADAGRIFRFCLGMTVAVPVFAWIMIYMTGWFMGKHTIANVDLLNSNREERKKMEDALARQQEADRKSQKKRS
ncbi:MAG: hypothetical protein PUF49_10945 [Firmicutes bacterium]|nr:hypothetical protein [Bacillota bacterium]